jgi:hypothetical protein
MHISLASAPSSLTLTVSLAPSAPSLTSNLVPAASKPTRLLTRIWWSAWLTTCFRCCKQLRCAPQTLRTSATAAAAAAAAAAARNGRCMTVESVATDSELKGLPHSFTLLKSGDAF